MLHGGIGHAKGLGSSIALALSILSAIYIWQFLFVTVANFLFHSECWQARWRSLWQSGLGLTLPKLVFGHVGDGFLIESSAIAVLAVS